MELAGKIALVTGGSSGIGRASVELLARRGAYVVVADLDERGGAETVRLVEAAGGRASFERVDVSRPDDLARAFAAVVREHGALHVLHNNAGLVSGAPDFPETAPERIAAVVGVNVSGTLIGTRLAIETMSRNGGGAIVNMSSTLAHATTHADPVYAATKAAIASFSALCAPFAASHGVRVNAVLPAGVDTPILEKTGAGAQAGWLRDRLQDVRLLTPEQVAAVVVALVEDDSRFGENVVLRPE